MSNSKTDKELVLELKKGNTDAFEEIFNRYSAKAYNLALRISRNTQDAEEIIQETFFNVFNKIESFQSKSAFSSWLYRITFNTALMKLRSKKRHANISLDQTVSGSENLELGSRLVDEVEVTRSESRPFQHELRSKIQKAVSELDETYREIFILRDIDGLSNIEVGEKLDISVAAVKSRLHRARIMLKASLAKYHEDYYGENIYQGTLAAAA